MTTTTMSWRRSLSLALFLAANGPSERRTARAFVASSLSRKATKRCSFVVARSDASIAVRAGGDGNGGFFDDYDDFLSNMDFENDDGWSPDNDDVFGSGGGGGRGGGGGGRGGGGRRGRYSSGGAAGHDYERARDDDPSDHVDLDAVNELLAERLTYKKTGRYDEADDVRDLLQREHGVIIWDKDRVWTTNGDRRGGSARHGPNGRYGRRGGGQGQRPSRQRRDRDFGPRGHDYELVGAPPSECADCALDEDRVNELLAERLKRKLDRDFATADEIQKFLFDNGVNVHDGFKKWRADGGSWGEGGGGGGGGDRDARGRERKVRQYNRRGTTNGLSITEREEVAALVAERARCKTERDFDGADEIRERLADEYDVLVDDKKREWYSSDDHDTDANSKRGARTYSRRGPANGLTPEEIEEVVALVAERAQRKAERDYDAADAVRERLADDYDVVVDDRQQEWFLRAEADADGAAGAPDAPRVYVRRGPARSLSPEEAEDAAALVAERADHKALRNYEDADEIRDRLIEDFNVRIDDARREWFVTHEEFLLAADSPLRPRVDVDVIGAELAQRLKAQRDGDVDAADAIQDRLRDEYGVVVQDVNKEYYIVDHGAEDNEGVYDLPLPPPDSKNGAGLYDETTKLWTRDGATDDDDDDDDNETEEEEEHLVAATMAGANLEEEEEEDVADAEEEEDVADAESRIAELSALTVPLLKERLREAGLPVSGRKAELIERLVSR